VRLRRSTASYRPGLKPPSHCPAATRAVPPRPQRLITLPALSLLRSEAHSSVPRGDSPSCLPGRRQGLWCGPRLPAGHLPQPESGAARGGVTDCRHGHRAWAGKLASAPARRRAAGGAVERAVRADGHLLPGRHRPAGPGDLPRQPWPGRDHPSSGCRAAGFTWRSSGLGRHRTRAAGWTSWCSA